MPGKKVLVIDDDKIICKIITNLLDHEGFQSKTAYSGEDALERLKNDRFLAIITDLKMGNVDGFEVTRFCKQIAPETKVIMITGSCQEENKKTAFSCGASAYLTKPFDLDELLDSLPRTINQEVKPACTANSIKPAYSQYAEG